MDEGWNNLWFRFRVQCKFGKVSPSGFWSFHGVGLTKSMRFGASYEYVRATIEEGTFAGSRVPLVTKLTEAILNQTRWFIIVKFGRVLAGETFMGGDFTNSKDQWLLALYLLLNYDLSNGLTFLQEWKIFWRNMFPPPSLIGAKCQGLSGSGRWEVGLPIFV